MEIDGCRGEGNSTLFEKDGVTLELTALTLELIEEAGNHPIATMLIKSSITCTINFYSVTSKATAYNSALNRFNLRQ